MGKYHGSPWGIIMGALFDTVGGSWKGVLWNRVRIFPTQRGTLDLYRQLKDGLIAPERFSFPQMNIRRAITQVLGYIARSNLSSWIYPVWEELVTKRGWTMTGANAFVKRNAANLLASMSNKTLEFDPSTNTPDLAEMLVSDGDLETGSGLSATYDTATGDVVLSWAKVTYTNGESTDIAWVMVAKKPLLESIGRDGTWYPQLFMYGPHTTELPAPAATRDDETITYKIASGLDAADLTAYLFFRDTAEIIGNSPSKGFQTTPAGP